MKKRQAQSGDRGIIVTALGYAMNARPGPSSQKIKKSQTGVLLEEAEEFFKQIQDKTKA